MFPEFTGEEDLATLFNAIFAMPSIADAGLLYGLGWALVLVPFLLAWVTAQISKALTLFRN